jgi:hypothetical protein
MNEDELYKLAEAAFRAQVRENNIPEGAARDSLWNGILDQLEAMPVEQRRAIYDEAFPEGVMSKLRNFFADRTQRAATLDEEEGTTGMDRFATGAVYGAVNAPHRIAKGVLGLGRMMGFEEPYNRYAEWSKGFEDDYNQVTPWLGKAGMGGEVAGGLPTDLPLYAAGMGQMSKIPAIGRLMAGGRGARFGAEVMGNSVVDFGQGALVGAGYDDATPGSMLADGLVGTGIGGVANVGMAGAGATLRGAGRGVRAMAGARRAAPVPPTTTPSGGAMELIEGMMGAEGMRPKARPTPAAQPLGPSGRPGDAPDIERILEERLAGMERMPRHGADGSQPMPPRQYPIGWRQWQNNNKRFSPFE